MKQIRFRGETLEEKRQALKWTKGKLAARLGVTATTLYRAGLNPSDPCYTKPGERLITAVLTTFPEAKFEEFFFFE